MEYKEIISITMDSKELWNNYSDNMFDFIYVDGKHSNPEVTSDVKYAYSHIKPRGVIFFDDYGYEDVEEVVNSLANTIEETINFIPYTTGNNHHKHKKVAWMIKND